MSLLPRHHDEFRSKEYWDNFFRQRGQKSFEWYGNFQDIELIIQKYIKSTDRFLVIGCGNSMFSSELYDHGYRNITNLDFSELVINEMKFQNKSRTEMKWDVGDMTRMDNYVDKSFDIVVDKGALDALMSVNTKELQQQAFNMFREIQRVLSDNGKYMCITLAESYIFETIIDYFIHFSNEETNPMRWCITIEIVSTSVPSPFQPFFLMISKVKNSSSPLAGIIRLGVDNFGNLISKPKSQSIDTVKETIVSVQGFNQKQYDLKELRCHRHEIIEIHNGSNLSSTSSPDSIANTIPRYSLIITDISNGILHPDTGGYVAESGLRGLCGVFFIPQGREHEYQFSHEEGLSELARQAGYCRLISVRLHRPHHYLPRDLSQGGNVLLSNIQTELSPIIVSLAPRGCDPSTIPFISIQADQAWVIVDQGQSKSSGEYVIEEMIQSTPDRSFIFPPIIRRLIFLQNQSLIQTEVRLITVERSSPVKTEGNGQGKSNKKKKGQKKPDRQKSLHPENDVSNDVDSESSDPYTFDFTFLDSHHVAALTAFLLRPDILVQYSTSPEGKDTSTDTESSSMRPKPVAMVIGLGGGAYAMAIQRYLPNLPFVVCDIDDSLPSIAEKHFGFRNIHGLCDIQIQDGLALIRGQYETIRNGLSDSRLFYVFLDVDSKDLSEGLTAPPKEFITTMTLMNIHDILVPGGIFVMNVAVRNRSLLDELVNRVKSLFVQESNDDSIGRSLSPKGRVFLLRPSDENVNFILIGLKGSSKEDSKLVVFDEKSLRTRLESWLVEVGLSSDPLEMREMIGKLQEQ